jgi:hypothetical protein
MPKIKRPPITAPDEAPSLAISREAAAKALSVDIQTIDGLIASKQLKASKLGRRVLVRVASLITLLDENPAVQS